jgi:hypothetical protein
MEISWSGEQKPDSERKLALSRRKYFDLFKRNTQN